jgi:hypothetical protein
VCVCVCICDMYILCMCVCTQIYRGIHTFEKTKNNRVILVIFFETVLNQAYI